MKDGTFIVLAVVTALTIGGATAAILCTRDASSLAPPSAYKGADACERVELDPADFPIGVTAEELDQASVTRAVNMVNSHARRRIFAIRERPKFGEPVETSPAWVHLTGAPSPMLPDPTHAHSTIRLIGCAIKSMESSIPNDLPSEQTRPIVHELGHFLGMRHSETETSFMYGVSTSLFAFDILPEDEAVILSVYGAR